jgi:hypothetical protein
MVKWEKSGRDVGDAIGYRLNFEYNLNKEGNYQALFTIIGWNKFADKDTAGKKIENTETCSCSEGIQCPCDSNVWFDVDILTASCNET